MKKMNEKEIIISLKAIRLAWFYTVLFLFIWITYDFIKNKDFNNNPAFLLLISQNLVFIFSQYYLKRKVAKDK